MSELDQDIASFQKMEGELEAHYRDKWVIFFRGDFTGAFDSFEKAAETAVQRFGRGPYLIRQVGAPEFVMPASVAFRLEPRHA